MSALAAFRIGIGRVTRSPLILIGMFLVTLLIALPLSLALRGMLAAHLGGSLAADRAASDVNYEWWQEFTAAASGLGTTFSPTIVGFGGVLHNLSGLMDNQPLATTVAGATIAWMIIWSFLSGGVLDRYARDRPIRTPGFFAACGTHFWRFLRLAILGWFVYAFFFSVLHGWIFDVAYERLIRDISVEREAFAIRVIGYLVFGAALVLCTTIFDFARVRIVVEDRRSAIAAAAAASRFVRRNFPSVVLLYLLNAAALAVLLAVYAVVGRSAPRSGWQMWAVLLAGQLYILARHYLKLLFYASETALFQNALAHAEYTAAPTLVWPDSPAVESITNAEPARAIEARERDARSGGGREVT
jgi:hypothetical protein